MIDPDTVSSVITQYEKFGWRLERIILKAPSDAVPARFPSVSISIGALDGLWFSRENGDGRAWELRRLTGSPFALVSIVSADATERERDEILADVEIRMAEKGEKPGSEIALEK